jgi:putative sigma-54 modulation protein
MFMIDLRSSNLTISEALREHVARRLDFAIQHFAGRIRRVVVRLVDVNGPKGGPDKRCRIIAHLAPTGSVIVEATEGDAYAAASQAASRLDERIARALKRRRPRPASARRAGARTRRETSSAALAQRDPS